MRTGTIFLAIVMIAGIYVLPSIIATFAGSHTLAYGKASSYTSSSKALNCLNCHSYIEDEATSTEYNSTPVIYAKHVAAASNDEYITYMFWQGYNYNDTDCSTLVPGGAVANDVGISCYQAGRSDKTVSIGNWVWWNTSSASASAYNGTATVGATQSYTGADAGWRACLLCHKAKTFGVGATHTRFTVNTCTYKFCHGNGSSEVNDTSGLYGIERSKMADIYGKKHPSDVGHRINTTTNADAHSKPFQRLQGLDSEYGDGNGGMRSADYYMCLACHSWTGMSLHIDRPQGVEFYFSQSNGANSWTYNDTLYENTYAMKQPGPAFSG